MLLQWLQWILVAIVVVMAGGYALLVLLPVAVKQRLMVSLGPNAPRWLAKRLGGEGGCAQCPANTMRAPGAKPPSSP